MENEMVEFHDTIQYVDDYIFVQPVCALFGINYRNQTRVIVADEIMFGECTKKYSQALFTDNQPRYSLTKKGFVRWIESINPKIVHASVREKFKRFEKYVFQHLFSNAEYEENIKNIYRERANIDKQIQALLRRKKECRKELADYLRNKFEEPQPVIELPLPNIEGFEIPQDIKKRALLISNTERNIRRNKKAMREYPDNANLRQHYVDYLAKYKLLTGEDYKEMPPRPRKVG